MSTCIVEQAYNLRTYHGVDGIERAEKYDVIGLDIRIDKVELVVRMILVENVFGIVVIIEEGQGYRRLGTGIDVHIACIYTIVFQKLNDVLANPVLPSLADKRSGNAGAGQ